MMSDYRRIVGSFRARRYGDLMAATQTSSDLAVADGLSAYDILSRVTGRPLLRMMATAAMMP
jgi:hypothetical protein